MGNLKTLKFKFKIKGMDELNRKLYMLSYNYERIKSILKDSERLIEEINKMELTIDVDRGKEGSNI